VTSIYVQVFILYGPLTGVIGIPIIYQGQEHHFAGADTPRNREALWSSSYSTSSELYQWIAKLNQIRTWAIAQSSDFLTYNSHPIYYDSHTIAMRKGSSGSQIIGIFTNLGSSPSSVNVTLRSSAAGFSAGQTLVDVMVCTAHTADSNGNLAVTIWNGLPKVLYPLNRLIGSGICPSLIDLRPTATDITSTAIETSTPTSERSPDGITFG
jgi:Domain of unknown function (DUF1966).